MMNYPEFAVIGGGSWGTALACLTSRASGNTLLYTTESNIADEINNNHTNEKYLSGTSLCRGIKATTELKEILNCRVIILATPSHAFESVLESLKHLGLPQDLVLLVATKGMCQRPIQLFSQKLEQEFANPYGFISGPNFAKEVAEGKFASITITSKDILLAENLAKKIAANNLHASISDDIITVQVAGIVKNIVAIKSGILQAQGEGENARAWLVSQGLKEIAAISNALGGNSESLTLPAVIGDLVLTSYSITSRNTKFGFDLHNSNYPKGFLANYPVLVEGAQAAKLLSQFIENYKLDLPVISSVAELV